ncbi:hypothetical protein F0U62_11200 [Cystobacter fuscus]|uniref:hypothetical protein n=1 Tax=Cystobacter fuscus TaxID=43 RepID=UPI002B2E07A8|nr:hypothetical protein F0U62_11200 [Cystobacter fuscus]
MAKSSTMRANLARLESEGWSIEYGGHVPGMYTSPNERKIFIQQTPDNPSRTPSLRRNYETSLLAHEVHHAMEASNRARNGGPNESRPYPGQGEQDFIKKFVEAKLHEEAGALVNQIKIRNEIVATDRTKDIGLPIDNGAEYTRLYDKYGATDMGTVLSRVSRLNAKIRPSVGNHSNYEDYYRAEAKRTWDYYANYRPPGQH